MARLTATKSKIVVDGLTGHLGQLEADGTARLPLAHIGAVERVTVWRHVIDAKGDKVAASQFAVDCKIEERQIARAQFQLQSGAD